MNNTDPILNATDTFNDGETSIAVNPANPREIVITAFSGPWGADAPIWYSTDGGMTWTKSFTVPQPPGVPSAVDCPCDQTIDYGRRDRLSGTFLSFSPTDVYSGTTTDPGNAAAWNWLAPGGVTQMTNNHVPSSIGNADQPWLLVNRDPFDKQQDNVYVAYDNFGTVDGIDMRVAVSRGVDPPNFDPDRQTGKATRGVNPGHRLAVDSHRGTVYSLFQQCVGNCASLLDPKTVNYVLNRSTDGGQTWGLNGNPFGIVVATAQSTQPRPKFGTVNALIGGVLHAAVDQKSGDVYYVYGNRDAETGNNRLAIRRIVHTPQLFVDTVDVGPERFVTGQVHAAIPSVAVAANGTVGVFYYTFDGFSGSGFPIFTAHLALSDDHGATFTEQALLTFLSPAMDNGDLRQRVLGDYMQMKALGQCFYGAFTANGISFGRPFANNDPIFFKAYVGPNLADVRGNVVENEETDNCTASSGQVTVH